MTAIALDNELGSNETAKYFALWSLAFRQRFAEPAVLLASAAYYVLVICVFSKLYEVLLAAEPGAASSAREYLWYIAVTEWIICAMPRFHLDIEQDVRLGDVGYQLTRPTSYVGFRVSVAGAELCANLLVLGAVGFATGCLLVGPPAVGALLAMLPLALLASLLWVLCTAAIGLTAFWIHDTQPLYWLFQKSAFVLGGLLVPLHLYPDWLRELALALPFSALLYAPARMVFDADAGVFGVALLQLLVWCGLAALLLRFTYARALRTLDLHGG